MEVVRGMGTDGPRDVRQQPVSSIPPREDVTSSVGVHQQRTAEREAQPRALRGYRLTTAQMQLHRQRRQGLTVSSSASTSFRKWTRAVYDWVDAVSRGVPQSAQLLHCVKGMAKYRLARSFDAWKSLVAQKEWQLSLAEGTRLRGLRRLRSKAFRAWRDKTYHRAVKERRFCRTVRRINERKLRGSFSRWYVFAVRKQTKAFQYTSYIRKLSRKKLNRAFGAFKRQVLFLNAQEDILREGINVKKSFFLLAESFDTWKTTAELRSFQSRIISVFSKRSTSVLLRNIFDSWAELTQRNRRLGYIVKRMQQRAGFGLVVNAFEGWRYVWLRRKTIQRKLLNFRARMEAISTAAVFDAWADKTKRNKALRRWVQSSTERSNEFLVGTSFGGWKDAISGIKKEKVALTRVISRWNNRRITAAFTSWTEMVQDAQNRKEGLRQVLAMWTKRTLIHSFKLWYTNVMDHQQERVYDNKAERFRTSLVLYRGFKAWRMNVRLIRKLRSLFFKNEIRVLETCFDTWSHQTNRQLMKKQARRRDRQLLARFTVYMREGMGNVASAFRVWKTATLGSIHEGAEDKLVKFASLKRERRVLQRCLWAMSGYALGSYDYVNKAIVLKRKRELELKMFAFKIWMDQMLAHAHRFNVGLKLLYRHQMQVKRTSFDGWAAVARFHTCIRLLAGINKEKAARRLVKRLFERWSAIVEWRQDLVGRTEELCGRIELNMARLIMNKWIAFVLQRNFYRERIVNFQKYRAGKLLSQMFQAWSNARFIVESKVDVVSRMNMNVALRLRNECFYAWLSLLEGKELRIEGKLQLAGMLSKATMQRVVFREWKMYAEQRTKLRVLSHRVSENMLTRLKEEAFIWWARYTYLRKALGSFTKEHRRQLLGQCFTALEDHAEHTKQLREIVRVKLTRVRLGVLEYGFRAFVQGARHAIFQSKVSQRSFAKVIIRTCSTVFTEWRRVANEEKRLRSVVERWQGGRAKALVTASFECLLMYAASKQRERRMGERLRAMFDYRRYASYVAHWKVVTKLSRGLKKVRANASEGYHIRLLEWGFRALHEYRRQEAFYASVIKRVSGKSDHRLIRDSFVYWAEWLHRRTFLRKRLSVLLVKNTRALSRSAFEEWRNITAEARNRQKIVMAINRQRSQSCFERCFRAWADFAFTKTRENELVEGITSRYRTWDFCATAFRAWKGRTQRTAVLRLAVGVFLRKRLRAILEMSFGAWLAYVEIRASQKEALWKMSARSEWYRMQTNFFAWRDHCALQRRWKKRVSAWLWRRNLRTKENAFYSWLDLTQKKKAAHAWLRFTLQKDDAYIMKDAFTLWKGDCAAQKRQKRKVAAAARRWRYSCCATAFDSWASFTAANKANRAKFYEVLERWHRRHLEGVFSTWVEYTRYLKVVRKVMQKADAVASRLTVRRIWKSWKSHVEKMFLLRAMVVRSNYKTVLNAFHGWSWAVEARKLHEQRMQRDEKLLASWTTYTQEKSLSLFQTFREWRKVTSVDLDENVIIRNFETNKMKRIARSFFAACRRMVVINEKKDAWIVVMQRKSSRSILRAAFAGLLRYAERKIIKRQTVNVHRCLLAWSELVKREQHLYRRMLRYWRWLDFTRLKSSTHWWIKLYREKVMMRQFLRDIEGKRNKDQMRRVFRSWTEMHRASREKKLYLGLAIGSSEEALLRTVFQGWVDLCRAAAREAELRSRAERHYRASLTRKVFLSWVKHSANQFL